MATNPVKRKWTVEEYLAYELASGIRHEFIDGEIFAMAGGSKKHSIIIHNIGVEIGQQLRKSKLCQAYESNMRIKINDLRYVYPDMSVVCGAAIFADEEETMLTNPTLVVEVLSDSTEKYDRGKKAGYYRSLPSVQAYLLLEQDRASAELYVRDETDWRLKEYSGLDAVVPLEAIGCKLALSEAYLNVEFAEE
jgi:Uma2 family endonuclease